MKVVPSGALPVHWRDIEPAWKGANSVCGYIYSGAIYFFHSTAEQIYSNKSKFENKNQLKENELRTMFIKRLNDTGVKVDVKAEYGVIDILTNTSIYELKYNPDSHALLTALGQLLAYSKSYPTHALVLVTNKHIKASFEDLFNLYNIDVVIL